MRLAAPIAGDAEVAEVVLQDSSELSAAMEQQAEELKVLLPEAS